MRVVALFGYIGVAMASSYDDDLFTLDELESDLSFLDDQENDGAAMDVDEPGPEPDFVAPTQPVPDAQTAVSSVTHFPDQPMIPTIEPVTLGQTNPSTELNTAEARAVLRYMKMSPNGELKSLAEYIKQTRPRSTASVEKLEEYRSFVLAGAVVPGWFAAACERFCVSPISEKTVAAIMSHAPLNSAVRNDSGSIIRMIKIWHPFCIRPLKLWRRGTDRSTEPPCGPIKDADLTGEFSGAHRLSRTQLNKYLDSLIDSCR